MEGPFYLSLWIKLLSHPWCLVSDQKHLTQFATVLSIHVHSKCTTSLLQLVWTAIVKVTFCQTQARLTTTIVIQWARRQFTTQAITVRHYIPYSWSNLSHKLSCQDTRRSTAEVGGTRRNTFLLFLGWRQHLPFMDQCLSQQLMCQHSLIPNPSTHVGELLNRAYVPTDLLGDLPCFLMGNANLAEDASRVIYNFFRSSFEPSP